MIELINKGSRAKIKPVFTSMCKRETFKDHHQDTYDLSDEV